jgi:hypothetical protein
LSITVSIKVRKELMELADKMVRYGLVKSRSQAFNLMIEKGIKEIKAEIDFWDNTYNEAEKLKKEGFRLKNGNLSRLLEEERSA